MKTKLNSLMILAMCSMLAACGSKYGKVSGSPYSLLNGRTSKKVYESLTVSGVGSLNYLVSSAAADAAHFANFVDGLVTHNEFGVLELDLAESASHNADFTEFEFKIRDDKNLVWLTYQGKPYTFNGETQYVKASDFVSSAKAVLTYSNGSNTSYMLYDFLKGAMEYYLYTRIQDGIAQGVKTFMNLNTNEKKAKWINDEIKNSHPNVYENGGYEATPITGNDIPNIESGKRLGVVADDENRTVKYILMTSAMYFPTMLTYSPYLPVNGHFLEEKGVKFGVSARDSILYNGPYILTQLDETTIVYSKNNTYAKRADIHGYNSVHVDKVKYNIVKADIDNSYVRTQFENGKIDGFSLSPNDKEGWAKYVVGPNGDGTIENPANGLVNSRLLDTIGSCYGTNINMERASDAASKKSYSSFGSDATVDNTTKAMRLKSVRQAIMAAFDYPEYYKRYADGDSESVFASQEVVHTYVPKNFVFDNNNNEYTEYYYAKELADYKGITQEQATELIKPGQFKTRQQTKEQVAEKVAKAQADIAAYNASELAATYGTINLPIQVEYYTIWDSQEEKVYDTTMISSMNKRLNGIEDVGENYANCNIFKVVPTDNCNTNNYDTVSGSKGGSAAFDFSAVLWGWGADYGDPLTYLNTYTKNGDWSSIFNYLSLDKVPNITVEGAVVSETDLLAHFTETVRKGQKENENLTTRYTYFAQAEVELINELAIYEPQVNRGQGWSLSISKSAGYEVPTSNYGISDSRMTGLWVLKDPLTRDERSQIRAEYDAKKAAYIAEHGSMNIYGK